jgi:hypothetical protein
MEDEGNSCVICYEPLSTSPVGTTVPCGHLFHASCFGEWGVRNIGRDLRCPMCNGICSHHNPFVRIFVNLGAVAAEDVSMSSDEEDNGEKDEEERDADTIGGSQLGGPKFPYGNDVIEILDDDDEPQLRPNKKKKASNDTSSDKYKKKAQALKVHVNRLEKRNNELVEKDRAATTKHKAMQEKFDTVDADLEEIGEKHKINCLLLREAKVELSRKKSRLETSERETNDYKQQASHAQAALKTIQQGHNRSLQEAQSTSLAEVRELRQVHTCLSTENQRFKEAFAKRDLEVVQLRRRVKSLESSIGVQVDDSLKDFEIDRRKSQKQRQQALNLIQFKTQRRHEEEREVARDERKELQRKMSGKGTALAARICRASEKKITSKASTVMDILDMNASKMPNIQIRTRKTEPLSKRKNALALKSMASPKRSLQNDIRTMFNAK